MGLKFLLRGPVRWIVAAWAVLAVGGLLLFAIGQLGGSPQPAGRPAPATGDANTATAPAGAGAVRVPAATTVATVLRTSAQYVRPGAEGQGAVPSSWWGRPSVLPVIGTRPGWVRVRVAQRPDGSTAWLPARDVRLGTTPYRIVIDLATTHLKLYKNGNLILSAPAGVGAADDPTPPGEYFAAFREAPPGPGYGPFVLVTSAHSPSITDWSGSGDAIIGIHGPLGDDTEIGTHGARISHGCVRLHLQAQKQLADVPPGTPIDITN